MIGVKPSGTVPAVPDSVAVLCDIHGNGPALEAVLAELRADPPDTVVIGGDVAAGPMPNEVLAALRAPPSSSRSPTADARGCAPAPARRRP